MNWRDAILGAWEPYIGTKEIGGESDKTKNRTFDNPDFRKKVLSRSIGWSPGNAYCNAAQSGIADIASENPDISNTDKIKLSNIHKLLRGLSSASINQAKKNSNNFDTYTYPSEGALYIRPTQSNGYGHTAVVKDVEDDNKNTNTTIDANSYFNVDTPNEYEGVGYHERNKNDVKKEGGVYIVPRDPNAHITESKNEKELYKNNKILPLDYNYAISNYTPKTRKDAIDFRDTGGVFIDQKDIPSPLTLNFATGEKSSSLPDYMNDEKKYKEQLLDYEKKYKVVKTFMEKFYKFPTQYKEEYLAGK